MIFLARNFPEEELETKEAFVNSYFHRRFLLILEYDENDEIIGSFVGELFKERKVLFLAYLAVDKNYRGRGLGESLVLKAKAAILKEEGHSFILGEVENPEQCDKVDDDFGDPKKRLNFYRKFGCKEINIKYFQPKMNVRDEANVPMLLLHYSLSDNIDQASLVDWFKEYVATSADDFTNPIMQNVLEAFKNPDLTFSDL
jgi:GNAT superfamily N-acetyltransferase